MSFLRAVVFFGCVCVQVTVNAGLWLVLGTAPLTLARYMPLLAINLLFAPLAWEAARSRTEVD